MTDHNDTTIPDDDATDSNGEKLWKQSELGAVMRVDPKTISRWVTKYNLTIVRTPGGHIRIPDSEVQRILHPETVREDAAT